MQMIFVNFIPKTRPPVDSRAEAESTSVLSSRLI